MLQSTGIRKKRKTGHTHNGKIIIRVSATWTVGNGERERPSFAALT